MSVLSVLGIILLLSFLVEALVEFLFGQFCDHIPALEPYKWLSFVFAMIAGVTGSFIYQFDLMHLVGEWLGSPIPIHAFGITLTGLAIGRGSNFIHDVISKFFKSGDPKVVIGLVNDTQEV
jgi:hypothetical protein